MNRMFRSLVAAATFLAATVAPAFATSSFVIDFEAPWDRASITGDNDNGYYAGGLGADGSTGPDLGVSFVGMAGLANDAFFTFYRNAPTMGGVAYAYDTAIMNVAGGVDQLQFSYSSPVSILRGVKAYSGLNLTGRLLGTFDIFANDAGGGATESSYYTHWSVASLVLPGTAKSFDFSGMANQVAIDNIAAVPEPESVAMLLAGLAVVAAACRRRARRVR